MELRLDRVKKIWSKRVNQQCTNLIVVWAEAFTLTQQFIPSGTVDEVFVNFPDPWPKRRHAHHRLIRPEFVSELVRCLKPQGTLSLVTDDEPSSARMIQEVLAHPSFTSVLPEPFFRQVAADYGSSFFDTLFRAQTKPIRQMLFRHG